MAYERINFRDYPNTTTPLDEVNLNRMDSELKYLDDNTIENDYWNASTSYDVGAFVIYENKLYRALVQNTNVAPNTSSVTWEQTNLTETLTSHNDEIVKLNDEIEKIENKTILYNQIVTIPTSGSVDVPINNITQYMYLNVYGYEGSNSYNTRFCVVLPTSLLDNVVNVPINSNGKTYDLRLSIGANNINIIGVFDGTTIKSGFSLFYIVGIR